MRPSDAHDVAEPGALAAALAAPAAPEGGSLSRLSNYERRLLLDLLVSLMPSGDPAMPIGAADVPLGRFIDDLLDSAPLQFVAGVRACLWIVVLSPLFVLRRFSTFFGLEPGEQVQCLRKLRDNPIYVVREIPTLLKTIGCLGLCGLPHVQHRLGIHPIDATPPRWATDQDGQ
jgi:hypothetical protein